MFQNLNLIENIIEVNMFFFYIKMILYKLVKTRMVVMA